MRARKTPPPAPPAQGEVIKGNGQEMALALVEKRQDALALNRAPELVLEEAQKAAAALTKVIKGKKKPVIFNGEQYLEYEDWQTLGRFYGVVAKVRSTKFVDFGDVQGFEAAADALLVTTDQVISSAEAMCLNDEEKWSMRPKYEWRGPQNNRQRIKVSEEPVPLFQLRSMAQTRACAKALRNVLSWVVVLAGYRPTPAEEIDGVERDEPEPSPSRTRPKAGNGVHAASQPCERCGGAITDVNHKGELISYARILEAGKEKHGKAMCATCQIAVKNGEPLELKPSGKVKPAPEANRGHGQENLNRTEITPLEGDPTAVEIAGWLASCALTSRGGKKRWLITFADGLEVSNWHIGQQGEALGKLLAESAGERVVMMCDRSSKGDRDYYNFAQLLKVGDQDVTVEQLGIVP